MRNVNFLLANETAGGIKVRRWCERLRCLLVGDRRNLGRTDPAFCDGTSKGSVLCSGDFDQELHRVLAAIQTDTKGLIYEGILIENN